MNIFGGQFIFLQNVFSPHEVGSWSTQSIGDYVLHTAKNLSVYTHNSDEINITLIGFAFHCQHSDFDEPEILSHMPAQTDAFLDYLDMLAGNFVIIIERDGSMDMYHDAAAAMKMFYYKPDDKVCGVASDPKILARTFDLSEDQNSETRDFYTRKPFTHYPIRLGELTQYQYVQQIMPNNYLNISDAAVFRYFPRRPKRKLSLDEISEEVKVSLNNIVGAAVRKYDVYCSLTAGWDSRVVLAGTKPWKAHITYFTYQFETTKDSNPDIYIPRRMSAKMDLNYEAIPVEEKLDQEKANTCKASFAFIPPEKIRVILNGHTQFISASSMILNGTVSEICKNYYDEVKICDGVSFAKSAHYPVIPYAVNYLQSKYEELTQVCEKFGYDMRDFAHWEQDVTNFAAQGNQFDAILTKSFAPFNCRHIIEYVLASPREMRDKQEHKYYRHFLNYTWPELNTFPVNPFIKLRLMRFAKRIGVYGIYKRIVTSRRK